MSRRSRHVMAHATEPAPAEETTPPLMGDSVTLPDGEIVVTPPGWRTGAMLNVRNYGSHYTITLWPEEFDPEHADRSIRFTNPGKCQDFVSKWYSRQSHDPRAR